MDEAAHKVPLSASRVLPDDVIRKLRGAGIVTVLDALRLSEPEIGRTASLSATNARTVLRVAAEAVVRPGSARTVAQMQADPAPSLSLGCPVLDACVRTALRAGSLVELAGPAGAGKTQLAMQMCIQAQWAVEAGGLGVGSSVVFVPTEGGFPARRFAEMAERAPRCPPSTARRGRRGLMRAGAGRRVRRRGSRTG